MMIDHFLGTYRYNGVDVGVGCEQKQTLNLTEQTPAQATVGGRMRRNPLSSIVARRPLPRAARCSTSERGTTPVNMGRPACVRPFLRFNLLLSYIGESTFILVDRIKTAKKNFLYFWKKKIKLHTKFLNCTCIALVFDYLWLYNVIKVDYII